MEIKTISQLEELNKVIPYKEDINEWYKVGDYFEQIKRTCRINNVNFDDCVVYVVNIFLDEQKNKYKNTAPVKCIIKHGSKWVDSSDDYCLITLTQDLYETYYRYNSIERIDFTLKNGWAQDRRAVNSNKIEHPNIKLFTTEKEAKEYIKEFKSKNNLHKYTEKLSRITTDIEILLKEKERLENLIKKYESNN